MYFSDLIHQIGSYEQKEGRMDPIKSMSYEQELEFARHIAKKYSLNTHEKLVSFLKGEKPKTVFSDECRYISFEEAREIVKKLKLKSAAEWNKFCSISSFTLKQNKLPKYPPKYYKNQWISWGDFLGSKHISPSRFRPFKDAVIYVRNLGIKDCKEWQTYCDIGDKPSDIPHSPQKIYKDEWQGWNYFLGVGLYRQEFYIETKDEDLIEEINNDIEWDIENVLGLLEAFREQYKTDEDILKMLQDEPKKFINGIKKALKKYPRGDDE